MLKQILTLCLISLFSGKKNASQAECESSERRAELSSGTYEGFDNVKQAERQYMGEVFL